MMLIRLIAYVVAAVVPLAVLAQAPTEFVPLTSIPGIDEIKSSPNLPAFLNNIYMIVIGAAAALAVLQIIRAGIYFMLNKGSISEAEEARHLLQMSVLGLLLVLSPVIVFGIINPKILELNFAVDVLKTDDPVPVIPTTGDTTVSAQCTVKYSDIKAVPGTTCDSSKGQVPIDNVCCSESAAGSICCGVPKTTSTTPTPTTPTSPTTPTTPAPTAAVYGWVARYYTQGNCTSSGCASEQRDGGPFTSKEQCEVSIRNESSPGGLASMQCSCDTPMKDQSVFCRNFQF